MKSLIILSFFLVNIFCAELDLTKFENKQMVIEDLKTLILYEEKLAVVYEKFLLDNFKKPSKSDLEGLADSLTLKSISLKELTFDDKLNNRLPESIIKSDLFDIYKKNTYRNNTYYYDGNIYSIFENDLASHLFSLIKYNGGEIKNCPTGNGKLTTAKQNCKYNNHIYINLTETIDSVPSEYNMGYFIENFKTGPIVFDSTKLLFTDNIFQNIPIGAILYDFDENKYIKTKYGIKVLK